MNIVYRVLCLIIGYLFGIFQTAYIYGKMNGIDIRDHGSGNSGTTNAMRVLGKKAGIITYAGDMLKALFCSIVIRCIFGIGLNVDAGEVLVLVLYGGLGVVLGHNYPFYMGFKGGKGIAASSGVGISLFDWKIILLGILTFAGVTGVTKYVSLGSIFMLAGFAIETIIFGELGWFSPISGTEYRFEAYIMVSIFAILAIYRHKANIKRLMEGTENKIGQKKKESGKGE